MRKFLKIKKFFQKTCKKFPAAAADTEKRIEIFQPPPRDEKNWKFSAAAAEKDVGLHL
jgi:hypothetical protein